MKIKENSNLSEAVKSFLKKFESDSRYKAIKTNKNTGQVQVD